MARTSNLEAQLGICRGSNLGMLVSTELGDRRTFYSQVVLNLMPVSCEIPYRKKSEEETKRRLNSGMEIMLVGRERYS